MLHGKSHTAALMALSYASPELQGRWLASEFYKIELDGLTPTFGEEPLQRGDYLLVES